MDDREKLVEILGEFLLWPSKMKSVWMPKGIEKLANHLIAHGVTVQSAADNNVGCKWISVEDRLPKEGAIVLCNTDSFFKVLQWVEEADMWFDQYRSYRKNYVTHWMPLPPAPKGE